MCVYESFTSIKENLTSDCKRLIPSDPIGRTCQCFILTDESTLRSRHSKLSGAGEHSNILQS